jgi:hypothetical protein
VILRLDAGGDGRPDYRGNEGWRAEHHARPATGSEARECRQAAGADERIDREPVGAIDANQHDPARARRLRRVGVSATRRRDGQCDQEGANRQQERAVVCGHLRL